MYWGPIAVRINEVAKRSLNETPWFENEFYCYLRTRHSRTLLDTLMPASQRMSLRLKLEVLPEWCRSNFRKAPLVKRKIVNLVKSTKI
jgi:hypothetical protein